MLLGLFVAAVSVACVGVCCLQAPLVLHSPALFAVISMKIMQKYLYILLPLLDRRASAFFYVVLDYVVMLPSCLRLAAV